ncbi:MAG: hypothetical protein U9N10_01850 [Bacillota bacterium]|nr:hypothetical protein [Bacillota bacterium]
MKNKKNDMNKKNNKKVFIFPGVVASFYVILLFVNKSATLKALKYSVELFKTVAPVLLLVLVFMFIFNLIDEKKLKSVIERSPQFLQYLMMTLFGIFSHGPIYAWYPLMKDFHRKGISYGSIATFLYARGIKFAMLPALISYFGIKYTIILTIYLVIFANIQGILVDIIMKDEAIS